MAQIVRELSWFAVVATVVAYATFLVLGNIVEAQAASANAPVPVRDELAQGTHHLSGMVNVPSACDELSVRTQQVDETLYRLVFTTWREPSVTCSNDEVPRYFRVMLHAPSAGIQFVATLDGVDMPIAILPVLPQVEEP